MPVRAAPRARWAARRAELALRATAAGHGSLVLLGAEAGAGKTSVVTEFGRRCGDDLARLAHHAARAHAWDLFVRFAPLAARQAAARGAHREAAQFLRIALERTRHMDGATQGDLWAELAEEAHVLDLHAEARQASERAVELRRELGDDEQLALALSQLGHARFRAGLDDQVAAPIEGCLRLLASLPDSPTKARAQAQVALVHMLQRRYGPAIAAAEPALEGARRLGDERLLGRALITLGASEVVMGDARRGVALLEEARGLGERVGASDVSRLAVWMLGSGAGEARLYGEAEEALAALVAAAVDTDEDAALTYCVAWQARIAFERGEYERAVRLAERVPPRPDHGVIGPITALGAKGRTMVRLGPPGAAQVLRQAPSSSEPARRPAVRLVAVVGPGGAGVARGPRGGRARRARARATAGTSGGQPLGARRGLALVVEGRRR